jgi:hypothetical protein
VRLYFGPYPGKKLDRDRRIAFLKALDRELDANWRLVLIAVKDIGGP